MGIQISEGELSNLLIKDQESFHAEKDAVYEAGLQSSPWQQTDDTLTRWMDKINIVMSSATRSTLPIILARAKNG